MEKISYTEDGQEKYFLIKKPNSKVIADAQIESSKLFARLVKNEEGILFRKQLDEHMVKSGLWDEEKTKKLIEVSQKILEKQRQLEKGGIKIWEARKIAIELRILRDEYVKLSSVRTSLEANTVEGQVENTRFDYIVINCILNESGEKVFNNIYEYRDDNRACVYEAANKLASIMYGIDENPEKDFPENKFLMKYGYVNDDLDLVNKDGQLVDIEGNLLEDEENIEFSPFLDDEGNPIE